MIPFQMGVSFLLIASAKVLLGIMCLSAHHMEYYRCRIDKLEEILRHRPPLLIANRLIGMGRHHRCMSQSASHTIFHTAY